MPLSKMAIFVTNKESTHEKSENQPDKTLPIVLEIPEIQRIIENVSVYALKRTHQ